MTRRVNLVASSQVVSRANPREGEDGLQRALEQVAQRLPGALIRGLVVFDAMIQGLDMHAALLACRCRVHRGFI